MRSSIQRLNLLLHRPDFQHNPMKAVWRRFAWRMRWRVVKKPWLLPLGKDLTIAVPENGNGALIYYNGFSEPDTANFILHCLKPGMVFLDIGAHVGEYTLLGAQAVGLSGEVHSFEPNPEIFQLLSENLQLNNVKNVILNNCAVSELDGEREFEVCADSPVSSLKKSTTNRSAQKIVQSIRVPSLRLDTYAEELDKKIDLVKVDVEGAEAFVFLGAERLLKLPPARAPVWIFECAQDNYESFGYRVADLLSMLRGYAYEVWCYNNSGQLLMVGPSFTPLATTNLIAAKDEARLRSIVGVR